MAKEPFEELREKMLKEAKAGIKLAYSSEENSLIQSINAFLETQKSYNIMYERLSEWFGIYFPEVKVTNSKTLAELALVLNSKDIDYQKIENAMEDKGKAKQVFEKAREMGREMGEEEHEALQRFASMSKSTAATLDDLEGYIRNAAQRLMPNASYLTDEKIAAEMLSKAGSMERLASMPASTIQLLGAEKALFKHIKFGSKPPKYGVLFKLQAVGAAPRDQRGRIARAYATKVAIALKADYYTKNFIAKDLKKSLDETIKKIKESPQRQARPQRNESEARGGFRRGKQGRGGFQKKRFKNNRNKTETWR